HDSSTERLGISDRSCCNRSNHRALTLSQSAHAQARAAGAFVPDARKNLAQTNLASPVAECSESNSTRAPPQSSIA
ncbi:MAG: hypothetical protein WCA16_13525, partial [Candidatus Sulfotelmatobacter sp.]